MLSHFDKVMHGLLEDKDTDSIYLDYAKAFDKVDHNLHIKKLERCRLPPIITKWITSFLKNRSQTVVVNGKHFIAASIINSVPQGTVLSAILFIIFINGMYLSIKASTVRLFAEDARILKSICCEIETNILQHIMVQGK